MFSTVLQVALGGAIGATARHATGLALGRALGDTPIPLAILAVNVLGSLLMGLAAGALPRGFAPFVMTGILGGFTTFSAFSLETVALIERGAPALAAAYVALSVGLSVMAFALGLWLVRGAAA